VMAQGCQSLDQRERATGMSHSFATDPVEDFHNSRRWRPRFQQSNGENR
jgi:hypothetical protein